MKKKTERKEVFIYQAKDGAIELRGDSNLGSVWATQSQIMSLFNVDQSVVSRHIRNLFQDGEVDKKSNMQNMHNAISDKPVKLYSLDVILGVGYRTNSKVAIEFRKWATRTLHGYIIEGYAVNKKRIALNYSKFLDVVADIKKLLPSGTPVDAGDVVEFLVRKARNALELETKREVRH